MMSIGAVTFWLVVTNIALGVATVAFWLLLIVAVIREVVDRRVKHRTACGTGSARIYVSETGLIGGMRRSSVGGISRN